MGTWAEDAFGNDTACDWAGDFSDHPSMAKVEEAIDGVIAADEYIESDEACEALVACEILARLKGNGGEKSAYSASIDTWIAATRLVPDPDLISKAEQAILRILGENSELQELWDEEGKNEKWHAAVDDLLKRVKN
jgi:hypothetical protein